MDQRLARLVTAAAAAVLLFPAPALAHGGDASPSESASPDAAQDMTGHDMSGHDMADMGDDHGAEASTPPEGHDHGAEASTSPDGHDHGAAADDTGTHDAGTHDPGHGQESDTVSPEVRRLVLTGFASLNGAVIVGAFLIRRTSPARTRQARQPRRTRSARR